MGYPTSIHTACVALCYTFIIPFNRINWIGHLGVPPTIFLTAIMYNINKQNQSYADYRLTQAIRSRTECLCLESTGATAICLLISIETFLCIPLYVCLHLLQDTDIQSGVCKNLRGYHCAIITNLPRTIYHKMMSNYTNIKSTNNVANFSYSTLLLLGIVSILTIGKHSCYAI